MSPAAQCSGAWWLLLTWTACSSAPPTPPPLAPDAGSQGAMVRFGPVHGYLARPVQPEEEQAAEVWIASATNADLQLGARVRASQGVRVLLVGADVQPTDAAAYLKRLSPALPHARHCAGPCLPSPTSP